MRRLAPRSLGVALGRIAAELAPATTLARVQAVWADAVGEQVRLEAQPISERDGTITVACRDGVWAQELDLMGRDLIARINGALEETNGPRSVRSLRFIVRSATGG